MISSCAAKDLRAIVTSGSHERSNAHLLSLPDTPNNLTLQAANEPAITLSDPLIAQSDQAGL